MNIILFAVILIMSFAILFLCGYRIIKIKDGWMDFMPSVVWQILMVWPFLYQVWDMEKVGNNMQGIGILIFSLIFIIGDIWKLKSTLSYKSGHENRIRAFLMKLSRSGYFYLIVFLILAIYHIASIGIDNIPLLYAWLHPVEDERVISLMREEGLKLLDVPFVFKYFFRWNTNIIASLGVIIFVRNKQYIQSAILLAAGAFYSIILTSKGPFVFFVGAIIIYFGYIILDKISLKTKLIIGGICFVLLLRPISYYAFNAYSPFHSEFTDFADEPLANKIRYMDVPKDISYEYKIYNQALRRIVMVPAVVGNYWYKYAIINQTYFGYKDMLPSARMEGGASEALKRAPSNIVGLWAYKEKWPETTGDTISANTSMDADAYGRGGMLAVIITALLYLGIRILLKWLRNQDDELMDICYCIGVVIITLSITSTPLHAILVAQGLLPLILAMFLVRKPDEESNS